METLSVANTRPDIILVNGPSSAGKTTICHALQARLATPYLRIGFDDFVFMAPERYYRGADTGRQDARDDFTAAGVEMIVTTTTDPASGAAVTVATAKFGPVFRRLIEAMAPAVRALVDAGNAVIFDHVLHDRAMHESCERAFAGLDVFRVGVTCPIDILEARERARGDRVIGRARGLADIVHSFGDYDVTVDTGQPDAERCVSEILAALAVR
ncbi:MAG: zeta toxin family protein [Rhodospirillaceae bacterium]|nr:zeta toxin family protein [Rhodospirillaceae bacterium]